jgi:hypothetical protein
MTSAVKTANIYFHAQHAAAAVELGARVQADSQGQAFCTRTDAAFVRQRGDCGSCDHVLLDMGIDETKRKLIVELHDAMQYPYDLTFIEYSPDEKVFNLVKEQPHDQAPTDPSASADEVARAEANARLAGAINDNGGNAVAPRGTRGRGRAAGGAAGG